MGILLNAITEKEQETILNYIRDFGHDEDSHFIASLAPLNTILAEWEKQKANLFKAFGNKLIISKPVTFKASVEELENEFSEAMYNNCMANNFFRDISEFFDVVRHGNASELKRWGYTDEEIIKFFVLPATAPNKTEYANMYWNINTLSRYDSVVQNIYQGDNFTIPMPNGEKPIKISNGMKILKIYNKINKILNIDGFEDFRLAHSLVLNKAHLNGELSLSIHPLDYMTMSDNDCDWESCMSWRCYGDYRQGTVEMMNSPWVVVAYLSASYPYGETYPVAWNSKKWRQLFVVHPDLLLGIRQYPYDSDELRGEALKWLRELVIKNCGWSFPETTSLVSNFQDNHFGDRTCYINLTMTHMYNDIHNDHLAYVSDELKGSFSLNLSGNPQCMACGTLNDISECNSLLCPDCGGSEYLYCDECGNHVHSSEAYWVCDTAYCPDCYCEIYTECSCCGESIDRDDILLLTATYKGHPIPTYVDFDICEHCLKAKTTTAEQIDEQHYELDLEKVLTFETLNLIGLWQTEGYNWRRLQSALDDMVDRDDNISIEDVNNLIKHLTTIPNKLEEELPF